MLILTGTRRAIEDCASESCQKCTIAFFDQQVINQARRAEPRGQQRQAGAAQSRHRLECFRVHQFHVVGLRQRLASDDFAHRGGEAVRVAFAVLDRRRRER